MTRSSQSGAPKVVHDLAEAFNKQSKQSNQVWLALIAAATLALFPDVTGEGLIKLPFSLGTVDANTYKLVGFSILTILMIAYCRAYAEAHIAVRLAHELIDKIQSERKRTEARRFLDVLVISTFSRVSPLVQLDRFAPLFQLAKKRWLAAAYYCVLKLVAVSVTFGIPGSALIAAYVQVAMSPSIATFIQLLAFVAMAVATLAITQVLYVEFDHTRHVAKLYRQGRLISTEPKSAKSN